jgi:N-sulphoglucosamine sulphohydrolase, C-terminal
VRTDRWRYIRYADGSEELYDHTNDPNEWTNLAGMPQYSSVKQQLAVHLPQTNVAPRQ